MSPLQTRVLLSLLASIHVGVALMLTPFQLSVGPNLTVQRMYMAVLGVLLSQPAITALWAGLAPHAAIRRWTQALAMLMGVELAVEFASAKNAWQTGDADDSLAPLVALIGFLLCTLPLIFLRARFGWHAEPPPTAAWPSNDRGNTFSLRGLLLATAAAALYLAVLRQLHPAASFNEWLLRLTTFALMGALLSLPGMLVLVVCFLLLLPGRGGVRRWILGIVAFGSTAIAAMAVAHFGSPAEVGELTFMLAGLLISAAGSVMVIRLCGYRLVRDASNVATVPTATPAASQAGRFALALAALALPVAVLAGLTPERLRTWRATAEKRIWSDLGLYASLAEGEIVAFDWTLGYEQLTDNAVDRISGCSRLERLDLSGSDARDETLARLGALTQLNNLSLCCTRVGDTGLQQLHKYPKLQTLDLRATDVTDNGLAALARLKHLSNVDLSLAPVTVEGIRWLRQARPDLSVEAADDDATLASISNLLRPRQSRPPPSAGVLCLRVRARGADVTDKGVAYFRGLARIAELDLTDAQVTDVSIRSLATLEGLRQLTLRGTQITDAGAAELQRALPGCKIDR